MAAPSELGRRHEGQPTEIKQFTPEAKEALKNEGYIIYGLTGLSIRAQRLAGRPFLSAPLDPLNSHHETIPSMRSEIAINPDILFLPESGKIKTLRQQGALVRKFSQELGNKVPGVQAITGAAADYVELAFQHLDATRAQGNVDWLFGTKYDYQYARSKTIVEGYIPRPAIVGEFHESGRYYNIGGGHIAEFTSGLHVELDDPRRTYFPELGNYRRLAVAPLVVPLDAKSQNIRQGQQSQPPRK